MVLSKVVNIEGHGLGSYNRVLGVVYVADKNINLEMIRTGLAEVYRGKSPRGFDLGLYRKAEADAKEDRQGMWSLGEKYISPRKWRRMKKN